MPDRIRALREGLHLTQGELAQRSGVTRQLISALEAGRHAPSVTAALGLARSLGVTVEALFGADPSITADIFNVTVPTGTLVTTARVGDQIVAIPHSRGLRSCESWELGDAVVESAGLSWLPNGGSDGLVIAGCDPALGLLADLVKQVTAQRVLTVHATTGRSLEALAAGRVHGVVVHSPLSELPTPPATVRRWHLSRWLVGLAADHRDSLPSLEQLANGHQHVVQRESGAGSQRTLERALRSVGSNESLPGPVGDGHVDVARRVANGIGAAGITMEPAARAYGLNFLPLEEHVVEVWIDSRWVDLPAVTAIITTLVSPTFSRRLALVGGYDMANCGKEQVAS